LLLAVKNAMEHSIVEENQRLKRSLREFSFQNIIGKGVHAAGL
jgi:hypothetical protein